MRQPGRSVFAPGYSAPPRSMVYSEADWTIKKENDPMQYYTAPMEGLTDRIWRQAHQRWFGAPGAPARYYAPFLSPPENRVLIKKKMAELDPAANPGAPVIPQLLAKDGALAAWMVDRAAQAGLHGGEPQLRLSLRHCDRQGQGCRDAAGPRKARGLSGRNSSPRTEGPVSVKTRLGVTQSRGVRRHPRHL